MHDAVADVLAERQARGARSLSSGIALSLLLHAVLFAAVVAGARRTTPPERVNVLEIRFAPASPAPLARPAAPPRTEPRVEAPAPARPAPQPKVEPKTPPPQAKPPARKEPFAPKQESVFGKSNKPVAAPENAGPPPPASAPAPQTSVPAVPGEGFAAPSLGTAGVTGLEGGDFPYTIYVDQMVTKIGSNWLRPEASGDPLAVVYFIVERDGRIREAELKQRSGVPAFDRAALRAVLESSPLPPLPFGYRGTWLGVHLTFH